MLQEANTKLDENRDDINAKLAPTFDLRHIASCLFAVRVSHTAQADISDNHQIPCNKGRNFLIAV